METRKAMQHAKRVMLLSGAVQLAALLGMGWAGLSGNPELFLACFLLFFVSALLFAYAKAVRELSQAQTLLVCRLFKDVSPEYHAGIMAKVTGREPAPETLNSLAFLSRLSEKDAIAAIQKM